MDYAPFASPVLTLTPHHLRTLIRESRGGFAPDHVARALRDRMILASEGETAELMTLLTGLIETAAARLNEAGIEPVEGKQGTPLNLTQREREYVENLCLLLRIRSMTETIGGEWERALDSARQGLAWCKAIDSPAMESSLHRAVAESYHLPGEFEEEERARRLVLEAARRSDRTLLIIEALDDLGSFLVAHMRLDESEEYTAEGLAMIRSEPIETRGWLYPSLLLNRGRVEGYRTRYAEEIRTLREALRWTDADRDPKMRAAVLMHLGSVYLRLEQFREAIRCQHEVVELGDRAGMEHVRGWGCFRLAEAHIRLGESVEAEEMLDRAEICAGKELQLRLSIDAKRAQLVAHRGEIERAIGLCTGIIEQIGDRHMPDLLMFACKMLGDLEEKRENLEEAERWSRRAIEICTESFPARVPQLQVDLARILLAMNRDEETSTVIDAVIATPVLNRSERHRAIHLKALLAERRGDLKGALDCEREAFAIERETMELMREEGMKNTRIVAEIGLLEREADLERDRRARVEHELAEAVVALGERKRMIEEIEGRIRKALAETRGDGSLTATLRGVLGELRTQTNGTDSPLRYMSGVDQEFYTRLRKRWPDLTPKQERLCGLIRAGLGSREISTLLELGPEGLKAQRKRLRKRLEIGVEEKLETVLAEV